MNRLDATALGRSPKRAIPPTVNVSDATGVATVKRLPMPTWYRWAMRWSTTTLLPPGGLPSTRDQRLSGPAPRQVRNSMMHVNADGTQVFIPYIGGFGRYVQKCRDVAANGYEGFALTMR